MKRLFSLIILIVISLSILRAEDWLTIYNDDLSLVRSSFELNLEKGRQSYNFDAITSRIEPASVIVTDPKKQITIAEQNYEYDLAGTEQIIAKYIEREVNLTTKDQSNYSGVLKFYDGNSVGIIESSTKKLILVRNAEIQIIRLAELPSNFYTKPTLHWSLIAPQKGKYPMQLTYLSGGFNWNVTYNSIWDGAKLILNAWVTIDNRSGKAFEDVNLKLIAGEINKIRERYNYGKGGMYMEDVAMMSTGRAAAPSFEEKAFHDFHMYTLDQKVSFANNQTKQIQLFPTKTITATAHYEYRSFGEGVSSLIKFENKSEAGIGIPLPKGVFKVYKQDSDSNVEFIGEDSIDHTGRNETVRINTGKAFDLVGKSLVKEQKTISNRVSERTIQITLRNNSKEKKSIEVTHQLDGNSKILRSDQEYKLDNDLKATFTIEVQPDKEVIFSFLVRSEY